MQKTSALETKGHFALAAKSKSDNRMMKLSLVGLFFAAQRKKKRAAQQNILEGPSGPFVDGQTHARTHKGHALGVMTSSQSAADITIHT